MTLRVATPIGTSTGIIYWLTSVNKNQISKSGIYSGFFKKGSRAIGKKFIVKIEKSLTKIRISDNLTIALEIQSYLYFYNDCQSDFLNDVNLIG